MDIYKYENIISMSKAMVKDFKDTIRSLLNQKDFIRISIATGTTLTNFVKLLESADIPFERLILYLVDEYAGLDSSDTKSCGIDLIDGFVDYINFFKEIKFFSKNNYEIEVKEYNSELNQYGLDICVLGVGIDGHVGFCYPDTNGLSDNYYTIFSLDLARRQEHVNNGWFMSVNEVPESVISLSLQGMFNAKKIMLAASYIDKHSAISKCLSGSNDIEQWPVVYFLNHDDFTIYLF